MEILKRKTFLKEWLRQEEVEKFLTFPDEDLILAVREHSAELFLRIARIVGGAAFISVLISSLLFFFFRDFSLTASVFLVVLLAGNSLVIREIVHWYFHLYIITTRKIVEVRYSPLFSEISNSVLLDQLRCTEIDAELYGFISELLDLGNVEITFDRPTHQEELILKGIRSPRKIANYLSSHLHTTSGPTPQQVWVIPRKQTINKYGLFNN